MNKNIEKLKKSKHDYEDYIGRDMPVVLFMQHCINLLEDFEKRLKKIEDKQNRKISGPIITKIISQEEKEKNIKVGLTDPE